MVDVLNFIIKYFFKRWELIAGIFFFNFNSCIHCFYLFLKKYNIFILLFLILILMKNYFAVF